MRGRDRREPVIGRGRELDLAGSLLDQATAGTPQVLLLRGEAGIGKTHLARGISARAAREGSVTLWGAGQEDLPLPYVPIAMALGGLTPAGSDLPDARLTSASDPARLWAEVSDAVVAVANRTPIVLVMDDLQWIDAASQALLVHLLLVLEHASAATPVQVLTIITIRTPCADATTLSTLRRLDREPNTVAVHLDGLTRPEVRDLLAPLSPAPLSAALVQRIMESSGGSPMLAQSILRRGLDEGRIVVTAGTLTAAVDDPLPVASDELDRSVVDQLEHVSEGCRDLLTVAAFLGDQHAIGELAELAEVPRPEAEVLIDEAIDGGLVLDLGSRFAFLHPQVRHVLFHGLRRRERQQLHLRLADGLEAAAAEPSALEVAHHLARAGDRADPARQAHWSTAAARQALSIGAWADAGIAAQQALDALPAAGPWEERADLHLLIAEAASHDFDLALAREHGTATVELAEEHGDADRWGRALLHLARTLATNAATRAGSADVTDLVRDYVDQRPDADPAIRAQLLGLLSEVLGAEDRGDEALAAATEARTLLLPDSDPVIASTVHVAEGMARWSLLDLPGADAAYERAIAAAGTDTHLRSGTYAAVRRALVLHQAGDLDGAVAATDALLASLGDEQVWGEHALAAAAAATTAVPRGDLESVERLTTMCLRSVARSAYQWPRIIALPAVCLARALRGDGRGAEEAIDEAGAGRGTTARYHLAIAALLGDLDRVSRELDARPWRPPPPTVTLQTLPGTVLHAEVATAAERGEMAMQAVPALEHAHATGVRFSIGWATLLSRLIGDCHRVAGELDVAGEWLRIAGVEAREPSARLEDARTSLAHVHVAAAEVVPGDEREALAHHASQALDALGALPLAATARRLGRLDPESTGPARRAILFTDLVESTSLNVRAGDHQFLDLVREHDDIVQRRLREHNGVQFKHTGDGVAAWFAIPGDAVDCAIAIRVGLERASTLHPELPLQVRAGVAVGEPLGHAGDLFGLVVVQAARLCAMAGSGEVLVSQEVADAAAPGRAFAPRGWHQLKGFAAPVEVHAVVVGAPARTAH